MSTSILAVYQWPLFMAVLTSAYLQWRMTENRVVRRAIIGALAGGLAVTLSAGVIAMEMLDRLRVETDGEYWNWYQDWPIFALHLTIISATGALIGAILSAPSVSHWLPHKRAK
ncbi:hypothetical protein NA78x_001545 [Anatilimnocola sp. NA78]|uniref:hypothetical protein n=1 Tax=Anatilimnocola sp. NA78 TaxID=3415683 RepID=UPI003CE52DC5